MHLKTGQLVCSVLADAILVFNCCECIAMILQLLIKHGYNERISYLNLLFPITKIKKASMKL